MLLKVKEAAQELSCSIPTMYGLIEKGKIPVVRIGVEGTAGIRIKKEDLEAFIESRRTARAEPRLRLKPEVKMKKPLKHLR